jgi:hypothetical protein
LYDYSRIDQNAEFQTAAGAHTRFGEVLPLLIKRDDHYVIMRHGNEITLGFDAGKAPGRPDGWVRDYLLYADGYSKDMDMNTLYPDVVGPLPLHAMKGYPYSGKQKYPDDGGHKDDQRIFNTRKYMAQKTDPSAGSPGNR